MSKTEEMPGYLDGLKGLNLKPRKKAVPSSQKDTSQPGIGDTFHLEIDKIETQAQVRVEFDDDKLLELATQIQNEGQRNPIEVAKTGANKYLLITGERRYRALRLNDAKTAKVTLIELPSNIQDRIILQLTENLQRDDLTALELASAFDSLASVGMTQAKIAEKVGKSAGWVSRYMALIDLPDFLKSLLEVGYTTDTLLIGILRKINEIAPVTAQNLANEVRNGTATRASVSKVYEELKSKKSDRPLKTKTYDLDKLHFNRGHIPIKPDQFGAKVEAKLANGDKVAGLLSVDKLAESDSGKGDWCWITLDDGSSACVETSTLRIKSIFQAE